MQAAFFDLDKTVIARSSGLAFGKDFYREGFITKKLLLRGMAAQLMYLATGADEQKMEKMREKALEVTRGWERDKVAALIEEAMGEVITPIIFREAAELIRSHQEEGRRVYIVSSSPEEVAKPIGKLLEVEGVIASRGKVDEHGRYSGELEFYSYGLHKAEAIRELAEKEGIQLDESFAYSDSITDLPMLQVVGNPVVVNPDRALRKEALKEGWPILKFEKPVTLRSRLSEITPPRPVVLSGVAVSLALAAGYAWGRRKASEK